MSGENWREVIPCGDRSGWYVPIGTDQAQTAPLVLLLAGDYSEPLLTEVQTLLQPALAQQKLPPFWLAGLEPVEWDRDYSPWYGEDTAAGRVFAGEADQYGERLMTALLPQLRRHTASTGEVYGLGYSLGGLAALYFHSRYAWAGCGSCSGSFWYPGWLDYLAEHLPGGQVYLSLGGKEKNTRHPLMCHIEEDTAAVKKLLAPHAQVTFVHEPGGHSHQIAQRLSHALAWLLA